MPKRELRRKITLMRIVWGNENQAKLALDDVYMQTFLGESRRDD